MKLDHEKKRRVKSYNYKTGDSVLHKNMRKKRHGGNEWLGPYQVNHIGEDTIVVTDATGKLKQPLNKSLFRPYVTKSGK